jgi:drug/metabolite transporter (DMT)-like permease
MLVFIQSAAALMLFIPILFRSGLSSAKKIIYTKKLHWLFFRALSSLGISFFLFSAVSYIPLVNAVLLANTSPLIVPFLAYLFMSQKMNHHLWLPIISGLIGIALVLHPDGHIFHPAAFLAIGSAVCISISSLLVRKLAGTESNETIMFYFFLLSTIVAGIIAVKYWVPISFKMYLISVFVGALYFGCQYLITVALRMASTQLVTTLLYSNIIFSALLSMLFWHTIPTPLTIAGILLTVISGVFCIRIEHRRNQRIMNEKRLQYAR